MTGRFETAQRLGPVLLLGVLVSQLVAYVMGLSSSVTAVAAGYSHSCAIRDGNVSCWASNGAGQLGDGTNNDSATPVAAIGF